MNARMRMAATIVAAAVVGVTLLAAPATADAAASAPTVAVIPATKLPGPTAPPHMGSYPTRDYTSAAAGLPSDLKVAVRRDLGVTPEQYLANADAAADAARVIASLKADKVATYGARIDGTELTVFVPNAASAARVQATGATAVIEAKPVALKLKTPKLTAATTDVHGGGGYIGWHAVSGGYQGTFQCSLGFAGHSSSGASEELTAGHCLAGLSSSWILAAIVNQADSGVFGDSGVGGSSNPISTKIGNPASGSAKFGSGYDASLIKLSSGAVPHDDVYNWGGDSSSPAAEGTPIVIRDSHAVVPGEALCKSGSRTGWTCGQAMDWGSQVGGVIGDETTEPIVGEGNKTQQVNEILSTLCIVPGDSGGAVVDGAYALGVVSASNSLDDSDPVVACDDACYGTSQDFEGPNPHLVDGFIECYIGSFFPLVSANGKQSVAKQYGSKWELGVAVDTPAITPPGTVNRLSFLHGTVSNPTESTVVELRAGSSATVLGSAPVDPDSGAWTLPLSKLPIGPSVGITVTARVGSWSTSAPAAATLDVEALPHTGYIGANYAVLNGLLGRDAGAAPGGTVYLVDTATWSDLAVASAAAAHDGASLIVTTGGSASSATLAQLRSLAPSRVTAVGATANSEATAILRTLPAAPALVRWTASDAYGMSRLGAAAYPSASTAIIATGRDANDLFALPAYSAENGMPLILVDGKASSLPTATKALLAQLGVSNALVIGSTSRVSSKIATQLHSSLGLTVTRISGSSVADTARQVALLATSSRATAVLVPQNEPLAAFLATPAAAASGAPVFATASTCIAATSVDALRQLGVENTATVGLTGAITTAVGNPTSC